MRELFEPYGEAGAEALANTVKIAERCNVELPLGQEPRADGAGADARRRRSCRRPMTRGSAGICRRGTRSTARVRGAADRQRRRRRNCARRRRASAMRRCGCWRRRGWCGGTGRARTASKLDEAVRERPRRAGCEPRAEDPHRQEHRAYFLIVWDFCNWARENGIPAGAEARASARWWATCWGCATSYRSSTACSSSGSWTRAATRYPDIDIDICQDGRGGSSIRPQEVRARRADHHLRHAQAAGGDQGRRRACWACRWRRSDKLAKLIPGSSA